MSYKVDVTSFFKKQAKHLLKKYPSLKTEIASLITTLESDATHGTSMGNDCYKIRLGIASKGKGKSGGARIITNVHVIKTTVYLLSIYDKSEQTDIEPKELKALIEVIKRGQ